MKSRAGSTGWALFLSAVLALSCLRDTPFLPPSTSDLPPDLLRAGLEGTVEPALAAGLEGDAPAAGTIEATWDLIPNVEYAPRPFIFRGGQGTVYLSFLLRDVLSALSGNEFLKSLRESRTDPMEELPDSVQEMIRQHVERGLKARMVVRRGMVEEFSEAASLAVSDAYHQGEYVQVAGRAFRVKAEFSLPEYWGAGRYPYALELSADGGQTWKREEGGYFFLSRPEDQKEGGGRAADQKSKQRFQEALGRLKEVEQLPVMGQPQALADFLSALGDWGKDPGVRRAFMAAPERDEFVHRLQGLTLRLADPEQGPIRWVSPSVSKPENSPSPSASILGVSEGNIEEPRLKVVALGLNPVSETLVKLGTSEGSATATVSRHAGGFAAHLSRTAWAAGGWVKVVALKGKASPAGEGVVDLLWREGLDVTAIPWDGSDRPSVILRTESGDEFRLTARSPWLAPEQRRSAEEGLVKTQKKAVGGVIEMLEGAPLATVVSRETPFVLAVGGQVPEPLVYDIRQLILAAQAKKGRVYFSPSPEMSRPVLERLLSVGPHAVRFRSQDLMRWVEPEEAGRRKEDLPKKVATLAWQLLQQYPAISEILVAMPPAHEMSGQVVVQVESEVVVSRKGAWQAEILIGPKGEQRDSFYRTGEADVALAYYAKKRGEDSEAEVDETILKEATTQGLKARRAYRRGGPDRMPTFKDLAKLEKEGPVESRWTALQPQAGLEAERAQVGELLRRLPRNGTLHVIDPALVGPEGSYRGLAVLAGLEDAVLIGSPDVAETILRLIERQAREVFVYGFAPWVARFRAAADAALIRVRPYLPVQVPLPAFLSRLLSNLSGLPPKAVSDQINLKQLATLLDRLA